MAQVNYFKQETDRLVYGYFDGTTTPEVLGYAKNGSFNIEGVEYFEGLDDNGDPIDNIRFRFMVGNISKFTVEAYGVYIDDAGTPTQVNDANSVLDFFLNP